MWPESVGGGLQKKLTPAGFERLNRYVYTRRMMDGTGSSLCKVPEVGSSVCYDLMKGLKCQAKESGIRCEGTGSHMGLEEQECHDRFWQPGGK